jgi:hypothetical protein
MVIKPSKTQVLHSVAALTFVLLTAATFVYATKSSTKADVEKDEHTVKPTPKPEILEGIWTYRDPSAQQ